MNPSISTSPVSASCTMAGTNPSSFAKSSGIKPPSNNQSAKKNPLAVYAPAGRMSALLDRLLKPPRARLGAVMVVIAMLRAWLHNSANLAKYRAGVKLSLTSSSGRRQKVPRYFGLLAFLQVQTGRGPVHAQSRKNRAANSGFKDFAYGSRQRQTGERLGQHYRFLAVAVGGCRTFSVSRHINNLHLRPKLRNLCRQFPAADFGRHHVGDQQVNLP